MRALLRNAHVVGLSLILAACGGGQVAVHAGEAQELLLGATAELQAVVEKDGAWSFTWTLEERPPGATAEVQAHGAAATLTPSAAGVYGLSVRASDGTSEGVGHVQLTFLPNQAPTADAGADQVVGVGERVELDGRGSSDPDGQTLTFSWSIVERPEESTASLNDPASRTPNFVADVPGRWVLELSVHDGGFTITDRLTVLTNRAPVALPGPDLSGEVGQELVLDGSGSFDPDDDVLQFTWTLLSAPLGSTAVLMGADRPQAGFTPDVAGSYLLDLSVSDGRLVANARINVQGLPTGGVMGSVVFVSPNGNDDNPGTEALPLATIAAALEKVGTVEQLYRIQLSAGAWNEPFGHLVSDLTVELVGPESGEARLVGAANLFRLSGTSRMTFTRLSLESGGTAIIGSGSNTYVGLNQVRCASRICVESGRFLGFTGGTVTVRDSMLVGTGEAPGLTLSLGQLTATNVDISGHTTGISIVESPLILRDSQLYENGTGVSILSNAA
ncbi:MAG TPA: PKD domain-containing protein, partial [Myxococcaceae bacterium]|nr:PKD domain-containing protein [Myxococcaceae bacterium]